MHLSSPRRPNSKVGPSGLSGSSVAGSAAAGSGAGAGSVAVVGGTTGAGGTVGVGTTGAGGVGATGGGDGTVPCAVRVAGRMARAKPRTSQQAKSHLRVCMERTLLGHYRNNVLPGVILRIATVPKGPGH